MGFVVAGKSSNKKQTKWSAADHKNDKPLFEESILHVALPSLNQNDFNKEGNTHRHS